MKNISLFLLIFALISPSMVFADENPYASPKSAPSTPSKPQPTNNCAVFGMSADVDGYEQTIQSALVSISGTSTRWKAQPQIEITHTILPKMNSTNFLELTILHVPETIKMRNVELALERSFGRAKFSFEEMAPPSTKNSSRLTKIINGLRIYMIPTTVSFIGGALMTAILHREPDWTVYDSVAPSLVSAAVLGLGALGIVRADMKAMADMATQNIRRETLLSAIQEIGYKTGAVEMMGQNSSAVIITHSTKPPRGWLNMQQTDFDRLFE